MDEEEILPYENFEAEILRARTGQTLVSSPSSTTSTTTETAATETTTETTATATAIATTTETITTTEVVVSIVTTTTTTTETDEVASNSKNSEKDQAIDNKQQNDTTNDKSNAETSVEAQLAGDGLVDELGGEDVNEDSSSSSSNSKAEEDDKLGVVKSSRAPKEPKKSVKPPVPVKAEKAGICYDFQKGVCLRGEVCRWSHTAPIPVSERPFNSAFNVPSLPSTELSEEEKAKRARRMQKFGIAEEPAATVPVVVDETVRQNRIKRFGEVAPEPVASPASIDPDLLAKAQADPVDLAAESRPTVLHICGTWMAKKKTKAILEFFADYAPSHVEWIDLYSCNVVFKDSASPRRALAGCSHPPDLRTALTAEQQTQATTLNIAEPALNLLVWRLALASRPSAVLLMRLATQKDVKIHPAERKGFTQYLNQHLAPQFPQETPKLVKVEVKTENLVDDADLKEAIEAKETVDAKGRTIRGRGLKVSGVTRGLGPFIPQEPPRERPVVKKEPQEQPTVKVEGSSHRLKVQLKGDATGKQAEPTNGVKESKKKLLVTKHGEVFTIRSSPSRATKQNRATADRSSISPHSSNKRPKKIITSRKINHSRSPSAARSRSAPRGPTRGRLRMDHSRSQSSTPPNKRKTGRARQADSRSLSPAARPKIASRVTKQRSRSRSYSQAKRKATRNKAQRSRSRSPVQVKTITTRRKAKPSRSPSPVPRSKAKRLPQRSPSRSPSGSRSPSPPVKRKPASSKSVPAKKVIVKSNSNAAPKRTVTNKRAPPTRSLSNSRSRSPSASRSPSNSPSRSRSVSRSPSQSGSSRSRSRSNSQSRSPSSRSPSPVKNVNTKSGRNRPPR